MKFNVINHFDSDQRGRRCFNCKQWEHHLPDNHATLSRQRQVQSVKLSTKMGTRATATIAKALHQCFRRGFATSWRYDRHVCWTWYCLDRFGMERWRGGGVGGTRMTKIQQSLFEKLVERTHSKREPSRFSTLTEKSMPQPAETENVSLHLQRDTKLTEHRRLMPLLLEPLPQTQEG